MNELKYLVAFLVGIIVALLLPRFYIGPELQKSIEQNKMSELQVKINRSIFQAQVLAIEQQEKINDSNRAAALADAEAKERIKRFEANWTEHPVQQPAIAPVKVQ